MPKKTETVTEYQTVKKEEEVERTYCDVCGERCDDEYRIAPSFECVGCNESSSSFKTVDALNKWAKRHDEEDEPDAGDDSIMSLLFILGAPLGLVVSVAGAFHGEAWARYYIEGVIGTALWVGLALLLIL